MSAPRDPRSAAMTFGGAALIAVGLWWLVQASGLIDPRILDIINRSMGALMLIGIGIVVILLSRRGAFTTPRKGARLYRSRTDRVFGGVLGGLAAYIGVEAIVLRIAAVLLTVAGNVGLVVIYVVMWASSSPDAQIPPAPPVPGI
jgi:phage shock protein PspC (stress-responsive transcriptional regulator)